jgi:hypothetical protein
MVFVHVDGDVVSGMAACQPVVLVCALCCGRMDTDTTDYVTIDVHKTIRIALLKNWETP